MGEMQFEQSLNERPIESLSPKERRLLGLIADVAERAIRRVPPFENIDLEPIQAYPSTYWLESHWNKLDDKKRKRLSEDIIAVAKADVAGPLFANARALANVKAFQLAVLNRERERGVDDWCTNLYTPDFERRKIALELFPTLGFDYDAELSKTVGTFTTVKRDDPNCILAIRSVYSAVHSYVGFRDPLSFIYLGKFFFEKLAPEWDNEDESMKVLSGIAHVATVVLGELAKALDEVE